MKPGTRALGVAESYHESESTLAGAVVRADRAFDGLAFGSCTVGGDDATAAIREIFSTLGREDVQYVIVSGIAPAWYNVLDLREIHDCVECPVCSVSFEESEGLAEALHREFSGEALDWRRSTYERQPPRHPIEVNGHELYWRGVGLDDREATELLRAFTPEGGRPEPLRIARIAARAGDAFRRSR